MSDIFISYKREDQATARQLANALEGEGWTVWWDPKLRAGERFNDVIEKALDEAKCVIVLWSKRSVESLFVKDEATHALKRKKLVPVTIQQVELPFRFEELHTPSLFDWDGARDFSEFRRLVEDISTILRLSSTGAAVAEEQRLGEAEERRKIDEERLRQQERQRAEEEPKLKADDETRRRIEEENSREQQEAARAQQPKRQKQRDQGAHTTPHHDSQPGPSPSLSLHQTRLWVGGSIVTIVLALAFVFFLLTRAGPSSEAGTSITTAKSIAEGARLSGSLVPGQERHFFQFTASSPTTRVILRKRSQAGFQGAMDVYDQSEKRVAQVREGVTLLPGINPEDQPLTLTFESRPGELYYIMVSVLASKTRGDYELTVRKEEVKQQVTQTQSSAARSPAPAGLNTSITTAKSIAEGATLSGSLVPGQERHFFQFTASSPTTRVIVRKRSQAGFQGAMDVYDQSEKRVAQVREGVTLLPGINPEDQPLTLAFESRPGELYYIMVSVLASKTRGDYELTVRKE